MRNVIELKRLAKEFMKLSEQRDELNEDEAYSEAFEVECEQRDVGYSMVDLIEKMEEV